MRKSGHLLGMLVLLLASLFFATGCSDDATTPCEHTDMQPNLSLVNMGQMHALGSTTPNPISNSNTPYEWTLLLQAPCGGTIDITKVCMVGDASAHFAIEGPVGETLSGSAPAAIRVTYDRQDVSGSVDNAALVIESTSKDSPVMVVPFCAQVIDDGTAPGAIECTPPAAEMPSCP